MHIGTSVRRDNELAHASGSMTFRGLVGVFFVFMYRAEQHFHFGSICYFVLEISQTRRSSYVTRNEKIFLRTTKLYEGQAMYRS